MVAIFMLEGGSISKNFPGLGDRIDRIFHVNDFSYCSQGG